MNAAEGSEGFQGRQSADAVLLVRPASFGWNPETAGSNRFQSTAAGDEDAAGRARAECGALAAALAAAGVEVHAFEDRAAPACPDAVFPNNWLSLHADGTVVLYPMLAPNRRQERRLDLVLALESRGHRRVERLLDLSHHELRGRYLEGTGSVVFDHRARVAYACRSPRTHEAVLEELCDELGYAAAMFDAADAAGVPVYHTNVLLSIGTGFAIVCAEAVAAAQREALLARLAAGGRRVLELDRAAMACFAANVLELRGTGGRPVLAASQRAFEGLGPRGRAALGQCVERSVVVPVPTIETLGGGSVRCMLAEIFLPRASRAASGGAAGAQA
jgi:hypothetical protein